MSKIKRKAQTSGFEAGEESFEAVERMDASAPDFTALEAESGFSAGQAEEAVEQVIESPASPASPDQSSGFGIDRAEPNLPEPTPVQPVEEEPAKKRYYSPGEVMKKKGCIGCGGMALAIPVLLAILALAIALF